MSRETSMMLGAALLSAAVLAAGETSAADACIPPAVIAASTDCSGAPASPAMPVADLLRAAAQLLTARPAGAPRKRTGLFAPRELDDGEKKVDGALRRFLCDDKPAPGDSRAREQHAEVAYARARLLYGANHFDEAAVGFRDLALSSADQPVGIHATQRYLESINVLGTQGAPACFDDMARDLPAFVSLYCKDGKDKANAEPCGILTRLQREILRLQAEQRVKEGGRGGPERDAAYEAAAAAYLQIWTEHGKAACEARTSGCERMEEVLYNAARAYQAAHLTDKAIAVRKVLVDPRHHLENTELARRARYEIGAAFHAMTIYDEAVSWYEAFARESPAMDKAPEVLEDAIVLRLGLGQVPRALADADAYVKAYGAKRPAFAARIRFAIGAHMIERADYKGAKQRLSAAMAAIDKSATIDVQIQAHAALGRALAALGEGPAAAAEYGKVRGLFRDPAAVVKRVTDADEATSMRALAKLLTAVGEATFFFAEEKRRAAFAIRLPAYGGAGRPEDVAKYTRTTVAKWLGERRRATDEAERAYLEVLAIAPAPPPRWVVASAERVARMHGKLAAELLSAPAPRAWKQRGPSPWGRSWEEIRAAWYQGLEEASEPERQRAKAAYRSCVETSVKYQYTDARSRACAAWLSSHYPAEHPILDELADTPSRAAFGFAGQPVDER